MHPQRTLIEAAEQVFLNEELISYHPDGKGHKTKGSVGSDRLPPNVLSQLPREYHNYRTVSPDMHGQEGTVTVNYMDRYLGKDRQHHAVIAPTKMAQTYFDAGIAERGKITRARMRQFGNR